MPATMLSSKSLIKASINHPGLRNIIIFNVTSFFYISKLKGTNVLNLNLTPCCHISLPYIIVLAMLVHGPPGEALVESSQPIHSYYMLLFKIFCQQTTFMVEALGV